MFEKSKFEKLQKQNAELSLMVIYLPLDADKKGVKELKKTLKANYEAVKEEKTDFIELHSLCTAISLEKTFGDVTEAVFALKTGEAIKIKVNEAEYEF